MPFTLQTIVLSSFSMFIILATYIIWSWFHATYIWRQSTITPLNFYTTSSLKNSNHQVPSIIHQTYRDIHSIPFKWQHASNSCRHLHPNYEYKFWSDNDGRNLVEKEFPDLLLTFDSYPYDIQRADAVRFVILYVYGGIYLDFDIICLKSLDKLLDHSFILPRTIPVGLSNDFIISKPKHPFLLQILNNLPNSNRYYLTKYPTVMFSTGPMFLTHEASSYPNRSSLDILSPELYGKYAYNSSISLFRHLKASSWHGNDALMIKWIYRWRNVVLFILTIFVTSLIYFVQRQKRTIDMTKEVYSLKLSNANI